MRTDETLKAVVDALQQNCGDMHNAARQAGISPHFLITWLKEDEVAARTVDEAQRLGWMGLESAAIQRGVHGVEKDVYYKGEVVGQEKQYSDALLGRLLEARVPAYKKGEGGNTFMGPTQVNIMPRAENFDQWLEMKDAVLTRRANAALPAPTNTVPDILQGEYVEVRDEPKTGNILEGLL